MKAAGGWATPYTVRFPLERQRTERAWFLLSCVMETSSTTVDGLATYGIALVDDSLSSGPLRAGAGDVLIVVGAEPKALERARSLLGLLGSTITVVGDGPRGRPSPENRTDRPYATALVGGSFLAPIAIRVARSRRSTGYFRCAGISIILPGNQYL